MLLSINNLNKQYQRGANSFLAVNNLSFNLADNEFVSIVGRSGSGKTTLLNLLAGILSPTSGSIVFNGVDIGLLNDQQMSALRNQYIGYIPQGASLLANLKVLDNVRLPFYLNKRNGGDPLPRARELLAQLGIGHLQDMYPASLSGGEARRVAIARALINSPRLLVADEPTSDLDMETTHHIMQLLAGLQQQGMTLLMVTHELEITNYADKVLKMEAGRMC